MKTIVLSAGICLIAMNLFAPKAGAQTPGGAGATNLVWLKPENFSGGTWTNTGGSVGNFTPRNTSTPPAYDASAGYNYHQQVRFIRTGGDGSTNAQHCLRSSAFSHNGNVTSFFVLRWSDGGKYWSNLISFNENDGNGNLCWYYQNTQNLLMRWQGNSGNNLINPVINATAGIFAIDVANQSGATGNVQSFLNGASKITTSNGGTLNISNKRIELGGNGVGAYGYDGTIQEVIVLSAGANGTHLSATDRQKVHSYLAIKYGFTLDNGDNYINSSGASVWTRDASYNNGIFGIGRDDNSGLNQKQSTSHGTTGSNVDNNLTVFLGNTLHTYNTDNTSSFTNDNTYLMLGHNGQSASGVTPYPLLDNTQFENMMYMNGDELNDERSARIYKAQITGQTSLTVSLRTAFGGAKYIMVSNSASFPAANTRLYRILNGDATGVTIKNGDYISILRMPTGTTTGPPAGTLLFKEDFGTGANNCDATALSYLAGNSKYRPNCSFNTSSSVTGTGAGHGDYARVKNLGYLNNNNWYPTLNDHTNPGNGYFFACDATSSGAVFFTREITGLCRGTTLYFSAWIVSLNNKSWSDKVNMTFKIYEGTTSNILREFNTGDIADGEGYWRNYGVEFIIPENSAYSSVTLKIENNSTGNIGNDFGLDDIEIRNIAPSANVNGGTGNMTVCAGSPLAIRMTYYDDGTIGTLKAQWFRNSAPSVESSAWNVAASPVFDIHPGLNDTTVTITPSVTSTDAVYYRLAIASPGSTNLANCRSLSNIMQVTLDNNCTKLVDDYVVMLKNSDTVFNAKTNDTIACTPPTYSIITQPAHGTATIVGNASDGKIKYTPDPGYVGPDVIAYQVQCGTSAPLTAKAYIIVQDYPDNVGDQHCYIAPPPFTFTFTPMARSARPTFNGSGQVTKFTPSSQGIPLVGDIDGDGKVEIVVPTSGHVVHGDWSSTPMFIASNELRILRYNKDASATLPVMGSSATLIPVLDTIQTITTPYFNIIANGYAIAKTSPDSTFASIFVCSGRLQGDYNSLSAGSHATQTSGNAQQLIKYSPKGPNGTYIEVGRRPYITAGTNTRKEMAQPMIVDFNGDGIPEVVAYNRIFNARTMTPLIDDSNNVNIFQTGYGHGNGGHANNFFIGEGSSIMAIADVDNDGVPEIIAGNTVYKVTITNPNGTSGNSMTVFKQCDTSKDAYGNSLPTNYVRDGATAVADVDLDGYLDVIVTCPATWHQSESNSGWPNGPTGAPGGVADATIYVWSPFKTSKVININHIDTLPCSIDGPYGSFNGIKAIGSGPSVAFVGDINDDKIPEICFTAALRMYAFRYNTTTHNLDQVWVRATGDRSGSTTMGVFDFNQDGKQELVYRDQVNLRVLDEHGNNWGVDGTTPIQSDTQNEYPVVADIDGDGHAEVLITGKEEVSGMSWTSGIWIYRGSATSLWAPARKVWNQFPYNAVNINEDLTVPRVQFNPATVFPSGLRPYNGYMMQQTDLNKDGEDLWPAADMSFARDSLSISLTGDALSIKVGVVNKGSATMEPPIHVTLYKDSLSSNVVIGSGTIATPIHPIIDTVCLTFPISESASWPFVAITARVNDNSSTAVFPFWPECDDKNNADTIVNPAVNRFMEKHAKVESMAQNDGLYANPVSVLGAEQIEYTIKGVNASLVAGTVTIIDTLPAYLDYTGNVTNPAPAEGQTAVAPSRKILTWTLPNIPPKGAVEVKFNARPASGVSASQPLFVNYAWVNREASYATIKVMTDSVYHQGAGTSVVTFSAGAGGWIFNASPQAVDYKTTARSGVIVVPDSGYRFAGWSHDGYVSMRDAQIAPQEGVALYDTLTVYGDVELRAVFEPETYLTADAEERFIEPTMMADEQIWAYKGEAYIRTVKSGSIIRIYAVDGGLIRQQAALSAGETRIKLPDGIYVVTVNHGTGKKLRIMN